jgi:hypothetical protein
MENPATTDDGQDAVVDDPKPTEAFTMPAHFSKEYQTIK